MTFKQLYDSKLSVAYTVDGKAMIFRAVGDHLNQEIRLKPYYAALLLTLFRKHPEPVEYQMVQSILQGHQLACPDETRLHRKVSELRGFLARFHSGLRGVIRNIRGMGYSLPLHFKDPDPGPVRSKVRNKRLQDVINALQAYADESLDLSRKCSIAKGANGFVLKRQPVHQEIEELLRQYEKQKKRLFLEIRQHAEDFIAIRIEFSLSKLKTYLGLARFSEFSITKEQWLDWHEHEMQNVLDELIHFLKQSES